MRTSAIPAGRRRALDGALAGLLLMSAAPGPACNVPVFRYALERWDAHEFQATVFHRGPLAPEAQAAWKSLENAREEHGLNLVADKADLNIASNGPAFEVWSRQTNAPLPWLVLRAPESEPAAPAIWAGPFSATNLALLFDSPGRREIARRLLAGESAVWVLLESGSADKDAAVLRFLSEQLERVAKIIQLPQPSPDDPQMRAAVPVRVAFSVLPVNRSDPREALFAKTLLHGETVPEGDPVIFPVFGRGRALGTLPASAAKTNVVEDACLFICGACSCEVKELNPGKDLLLAANWDSIFDGSGVVPEKTTPPQPSPLTQADAGTPRTAAPAATQPLLAQANTLPNNPPATEPRPVGVRSWLLMGAGLCAMVFLASGWLLLRSRGR